MNKEYILRQEQRLRSLAKLNNLISPLGTHYYCRYTTRTCSSRLILCCRENNTERKLLDVDVRTFTY